MNKDINIADILKNAPKETKLWSPICGECELVIVDTLSEYPIKVSNGKDGFLFFLSDGRYVDCIGGECLLFPSKNNRDWSTFKAPWKHKHFKPFCTLIGKAAKFKGKKKKWYKKQELYWNGRVYKRDSEDYQNLLNRAYNQLNTNNKFRKALEATKGCTLEHSIGKNNISETVLTKKEFCSRLTYLRDNGPLPEHEERLP